MQDFKQFIAKHDLKLHLTSVSHRDFSQKWPQGAQHFVACITKDGGAPVWSGFYTYGAAHTVYRRAASKCLPDVLLSLQMDAGMSEEDFEDWADALGYNSDSIKDHKLWEACRDVRRTLEVNLGHVVFNELMGLEE